MHDVTFTHMGKSIDLLKHKEYLCRLKPKCHHGVHAVTFTCTLSLSHTEVAALRRFSWISSGCPRVFGSEASYRRRSQGRWWSRGPTPPVGASKACPRLGGCGHPVAPLRLCFVVPCCSGKIMTLAFVLS